MEHKSQIQVPRVKLGTQGLEVSRLGFGCGGLSGIFNAPLSHEAGCSILKEAFHKGITFFDTSDIYGENHDSEIMIGKALKQLPREQVQLATKFGVVSIDWSRMEVKGTPDYVRQCCEASLKRLDVDYIDLFYTHRVDISVPIEDTMKMGELKKLVEEGKIKYIGLSEASVDTIRRAHAVHPITAVEMEYSLWTRDIEEDVIPLCRELGIGIVAYSPLGQGFFGGKAVVENLPAESVLAMHPKFTGENLEKNKILYTRFAELAAKHGCRPPQLALAWLLHQGNDVVPIPGTTKIKNLDANIGSVAVKLTHNDLKEISDAIPVNEVGGKKELNLLFKFTYSELDWRCTSSFPTLVCKKCSFFLEASATKALVSSQGMEHESKIQVPRVKLGAQGLETKVSRLGFGCGGLSGILNAPLSHEAGCSILKEAFHKGITFFDTADVCGQKHDNEIMIGKALKELPREQVQLATKCGIISVDWTHVEVKGTPDYVRQCCEASLKRLDVDYIDLFYTHRVDLSLPIEDTEDRGAQEASGGGKNKIHWIIRSQCRHNKESTCSSSYHCRTNGIFCGLVTLKRMELGIGIVAYSPLGRGFFGGKAVVENLPAESSSHPRFSGENLEKNKILYARFADLAAKHGCSPPQLALAWLFHQGNDVVPIPGTTKIKNLDANIGSVAVKLTQEDLKEISDAIPIDEVSGVRELDFLSRYTYRKSAISLLPIFFSNHSMQRSVLFSLKHIQLSFDFFTRNGAQVPNPSPKSEIGYSRLGVVSRLGFGSGGLSGILNAPLSHEAGCSILKEAFRNGITFFDTADVYGQNHDNEIMIGEALKQLPREKIQLATKCGIISVDGIHVEIKGSPDYVRQCCEASLKRLDVDYIDLFYMHRVDLSVPIEDTMGELKKLVEEGKIKYIGLSEASVDTIRRAHAVHPIAAVQMEYSLWTRDIEEDVLPLCRELGIGIVAYSPLGRGFFGGKAVVENLPAESMLSMHPRFSGENLEKNKILYAQFADLAAKHGCGPPQLALAWLFHQGNDVIPIPGTTKIKNLDANIGSVAVKLTHDDLKEISDAIPIDDVSGVREFDLLSRYTYS
ncbi:unnamed protein product [Camellia sinensis]